MNESGQAALAPKALAAVRREKMLHDGENVLVALSGGADSMALLIFLCHYREELKLGSLSAAHINHGLRGEEAKRDEDFVRSECERLGVPLFVYKTDVAAEAQKRGEGIEEAGRRVRYAYLAKQAESLNACVATAHTLSDSIETVLFHMARGCGLRGLCGIPPVRFYRGDTGQVKIIRPLIDCTRADTEEFCAAQDIPFVQDSTNADISFARNRIRHCLVPEFRSINAGAEEAFLRLMRHARSDEALLNELAEDALGKAELTDGRDGYDAGALYRLPQALRVRALESAIRKKTECRCSDVQLMKIEALFVHNGSFTLNGTTQVRVSQGRFAVIVNNNKTESKNISQEILLKPGISCIFNGRIYMPRLLSIEEFKKQQKVHKNLLKNALDYDKITGKLILRARRPGDSCHPAGRGIKKTLKKLFGEAKLPAERRDAVPLVCDQNGIVLVGGFGCDDRVRIDEAARRVLVLYENERVEQ